MLQPSEADYLRTMFNLRDGEKIEVLLETLVQRIRVYRMLVGNLIGTNIPVSTLAILVQACVVKVPAWLKKDVEIIDMRSGQRGKVLFDGPCGWVVCEIEGREVLAHPTHLELPKVEKSAKAA